MARLDLLATLESTLEGAADIFGGGPEPWHADAEMKFRRLLGGVRGAICELPEPTASVGWVGAASDLALPSGWTCDRHGIGRHSVFGSYRVATEGADGNGLIEKLVGAIEGGSDSASGPGSPPASAVTVFYDKRCLNAGESWELGIKNGLEGASLVMSLVSTGALQGMIDHADAQRDNLLMEWETALDRQRRGLCLLLPIFIEDAGGQPRSVDFREATYPEAPHFFSGISIRATVAALFKIGGLTLALDRSGTPDPAQLAEAVRHVRLMLGSQGLQTSAGPAGGFRGWASLQASSDATAIDAAGQPAERREDAGVAARPLAESRGLAGEALIAGSAARSPQADGLSKATGIVTAGKAAPRNSANVSSGLTKSGGPSHSDPP